MSARDEEQEKAKSSAGSREGNGHSTTPQVQTPDKPSQAEGDRETIDESIREKEAEGER